MPLRRGGTRPTYKVHRVGREGTAMLGQRSTYVTSDFKDAVRKGTDWTLAKDAKGNRLWHVEIEDEAGAEVISK